jgi:2-polyprenyl-3-methyl-5-hydroxy-6-metoxy-1,4-benzoquinol methylase
MISQQQGGSIQMDSMGTKSFDHAMTETSNQGELQAGSTACPLCDSGKVSDFMLAPDRFHMRLDLYKLMRCLSCSCVWLANPPKPQEMSRHYDEDYHRAITAAGEGNAASRWKRFRELIERHRHGGAILDIGCSSGGFLSTMQGSTWQLYGIEMDASTAQRARKNTGAEVFTGDAMEAVFAPESFDVITTFDVLEHVYQPEQFLGKIKRWLKPGGIYYTMLPNIDSWEARMLGSYWYGLELPRHLFHFSPQSLRNLMKSLGFAEVEIKTPTTSYIEYSAGYISDSMRQKWGGHPTPLAKIETRSVPFRAFRKAMRLSVVAPFAKIASVVGSGPSMEAVFTKPLE